VTFRLESGPSQVIPMISLVKSHFFNYFRYFLDIRVSDIFKWTPQRCTCGRYDATSLQRTPISDQVTKVGPTLHQDSSRRCGGSHRWGKVPVQPMGTKCAPNEGSRPLIRAELESGCVSKIPLARMSYQRFRPTCESSSESVRNEPSPTYWAAEVREDRRHSQISASSSPCCYKVIKV
jgi:hypothetical protein